MHNLDGHIELSSNPNLSPASCCGAPYTSKGSEIAVSRAGPTEGGQSDAVALTLCRPGPARVAEV
jgi:hypothetical protein